jgi:hypothetical protein
MATMCAPYPFNRRTLKKGDTMVCIKIPFKEGRIRIDFYNFNREEEILIGHPYLNKKDLNDRFEWFGY